MKKICILRAVMLGILSLGGEKHVQGCGSLRKVFPISRVKEAIETTGINKKNDLVNSSHGKFTSM